MVSKLEEQTISCKADTHRASYTFVLVPQLYLVNNYIYSILSYANYTKPLSSITTGNIQNGLFVILI